MNDLEFLKVCEIYKGFGSGDSFQEVLKGTDFSVKKGEFCVLLEPSGSGKSTLLNIIGGIENPDSGYVSVSGDKLMDMDEKALTRYRRKHLGYVFQLYNLIPNLNVKENIEVGANLSENPLPIDELLETLGLDVASKQLDNSMGGFADYISYACLVIAMLIIYLLTKLIIEKNSTSISMTKVLGYENKEINKLYIRTTTIVIIISTILASFIGIYLVAYLFRFILYSMNGWFDLYISYQGIIKMILIVVIAYFIVSFITMRQIRKIPLNQALKDVE